MSGLMDAGGVTEMDWGCREMMAIYRTSVIIILLCVCGCYTHEDHMFAYRVMGKAVGTDNNAIGGAEVYFVDNGLDEVRSKNAK